MPVPAIVAAGGEDPEKSLSAEEVCAKAKGKLNSLNAPAFSSMPGREAAISQERAKVKQYCK